MKLAVIRPGAAAVIALAAAACAPVSTARAPLTATSADVSEFTVAGVQVIFKPIRANDVIAARLYLRGGSANLTPETAGIESFIASAAERGTVKYDKDAFAQLATRTGVSFGGSADYDLSVLAAQGVRQHWNEMWDLFTQAALHPTFPAAEVEVVRGQILNSLRQIQDDPDSYLALLGDSVVYLNHPYAVVPQGTPASIQAITRDALARWHRARMTKENLLLVVVGNVDRADLERKVAESFGPLPAAGGTAIPLRSLATLPRDVLIVQRQLPTNYIAGYFAAPSPADPDYAAFVAATDVLSDRLFEEVRTKRNLSYATYARLFSRRSNVGQIYVTAVNPDTTLRIMLAEVSRMQREPMPADRLAENVSVLLTSYWLRNESNMNQASRLGVWELLGGGWENAARYPDRLRAVTPADIQRVAQRYLKDARFVVIGDPSKVTKELFKSM